MDLLDICADILPKHIHSFLLRSSWKILQNWDTNTKAPCILCEHHKLKLDTTTEYITIDTKEIKKKSQGHSFKVHQTGKLTKNV